jgi:deoxycytidylate deaminase
MKKCHAYYCDAAQDMAMKSAMTQKHGCVIVHNNEIIAKGTNMCYKNVKNVISIHAEVNAINQLRKIINKTGDKSLPQRCKLYVVRIGKSSMDYPLKNSKPCEMCAKAILNIGIGQTYYSTNEEFDKVFDKYVNERMKNKNLTNKQTLYTQDYEISNAYVYNNEFKTNKRLFHKVDDCKKQNKINCYCVS